MIHSKIKFNTRVNYFIYPLMVIVLGFLLFDWISGHFFHHHFIRYKSTSGKHDTLLFTMLIFAFLLTIFQKVTFFYKLQNIVINLEERTLIFKKVFFKNERKYKFEEIDGYFNTFVSSRYGSSEVILFIIRGQIETTISSEHYSNFKEIINGLKEIKYLGRIQYYFWNKKKIINRKLMHSYARFAVKQFYMTKNTSNSS